MTFLCSGAYDWNHIKTIIFKENPTEHDFIFIDGYKIVANEI